MQVYAGSAVAATFGAFGVGQVMAGGEQTARRVLPTSEDVTRVERERKRSGSTRRFALIAAPTSLDLVGRVAQTWGFNSRVPHQALRATAGDELQIKVANRLPSPTSVHWHGLALRNDMDGVPGVTRPSIASGEAFTYRFIAPHPGTYWFHPHVGVQLDTGLQGALVIEDPNEPLVYDEDITVVLDDWTDGVGASPTSILRRLGVNGMSDMGSMSGMDAASDAVTLADPLGKDAGDVAYPLHLINGRPSEDPAVFTAKPGQRLRMRVINAAADTAYRVELSGHRLTVVASDGYPVEPVVVDSLVIGMGERYDVLIEAADGAFPLMATPLTKADPSAMAILRTSISARTPRPSAVQGGRLLRYADLSPTDSVALSRQSADRLLSATLTMTKGGRRWLINGRTYGEHIPLDVREGERVRLRLENRTTMFHPMHLHGHTFAVMRDGQPSVRKDTLNVLASERVFIDFAADNPGQWLFHCHNAYHGELGMMTVLSYVQ